MDESKKDSFELEQENIKAAMVGRSMGYMLKKHIFDLQREIDPELECPALGYIACDINDFRRHLTLESLDLIDYPIISQSDLPHVVFKVRPSAQPGQYIFKVNLMKKLRLVESRSYNDAPTE